ncbi:MAG: UDP-3-O-acyl-N-acetylglucosamine deacetylase [Snowella sp.]|nr:UDP-3-O-acyl-N-acetylglucosamine deacetylase [Snowella sp.]
MPKTLKESFTVQGVGLHSGIETQVRVVPSPTGQGRYFVRTDLAAQPIIRANLAIVQEAMLSTQLGEGTATVRTVEHLLAALVASGVNDARIEIDGPEVPLLDGSAKVWIEAIASVTLQAFGEDEQPAKTITEPIVHQEGDMFVMALPAPHTLFTYGVDYPYGPIGKQWYSWNPQIEDFSNAIAPARTFGFADQIEKLRQMGLIKGGSLDNALVCDHEKWLNPPLRFADEPVRHKLLDLIGDLSLLGQIPQAHYIAYKASHKLHTQLAKKIAELP